MTKIYTKTGDKGKTSLFNGQRVLKSNLRVATYGTVDELNSLLGVVTSEISNSKFQIPQIQKELTEIQNDLLEIGSALANPDSTTLPFLPNRVRVFEETIDSLTAKLPPLRNFILPGGGKAGSFLHLARSVTRRVERELVDLSQKEAIDPQILQYVNRLSDLLFTFSRFVNFEEKQKEIIWKKK